MRQPVTVASMPAEARSSGEASPSSCPRALSLDEVLPLMEAGLCATSAPFRGHLACDEWRAFLTGSAARLPVRSFVVGETFRVERANNGSVVWSEHNPLYALFNDGPSEALASVRLLEVSADNADEERQAAAYMDKAYRGGVDSASELHRYIREKVSGAALISLLPSDKGAAADLGCAGRLYVRQTSNRVYVLASTKHSNAWEYDSHPVLYFSVMAAP